MDSKSVVIEGKNLTIGYRHGKREEVVHRNLNFRLCRGELTCLLGANGAGKSTLLRTLAAVQSPLAGDIFLLGRALSGYSPKERSRAIGIVLTDKTQAGGLSVRELVALGRQPHTGFFGRLSREDNEKIDHALRAVGIDDKASKYTAELSDGERQKVMIAKALAQETPVIFLDEPTAFLDFPSKVEIMQLLHHLSRSTNKTIFLSTHDLELALQIADKIWLMDKANGVTIGTPEDLSIDGCLSNFFSRKGIVFDMETGLFRIDNEFEKEVRLVGHGNKYAMVRKALQRNGILASRRVESDFYIETGDMTTSGYIIHPVAGRTIKVDTIEELLEQVTAILASV